MTAFAFNPRNGAKTRTWILRQPNQWTLDHVPDHVPREFGRYGALARSGLPVQKPIFHDDSGSHFGSPGMVIEYVEGSTDLNPIDLEGYLEQFVHLLVRIHQSGLRAEELLLPETERLGFKRFSADTSPQADPFFQVDRIWAALKAHADRPSINQAVLLHGDYWPGNILWREGSLVAVIDWEESVMGDPLHDVSISRLDLWWAFGPDAARTFTRRYFELNPVDRTRLPLWDLQTALRPVTNLEEWAASYPPQGRPDVTVDHMKQIHRAFVTQAFEGIEER
jgi:aminoglycoside phosphotransferase (APT) family kinase protein